MRAVRCVVEVTVTLRPGGTAEVGEFIGRDMVVHGGVEGYAGSFRGCDGFP